MIATAFNPNVGWVWVARDATPLGLFVIAGLTQGSSFRATLGFDAQSLWD